MYTRTLEVKRTLNGVVAPEGNVIFDEQSISTPGISYDAATGIITFNKTGQYSARWWVATETTPKGAIEFGLRFSQGDLILGSSPQKTGQVSGFGAIDIMEEGSTVSLVNTTATNNVYSIEVVLKAYLLILPIADVDSGLTGPTGPQGVIGPTGPQGDTGAIGADGRSAYQVAVDDGFIGTEEEWLASLVGPTGSTGPTEIWGIEVGLLNSQRGTIEKDAPLVFDTVLSQVGSAISYDDTTGEFTIFQNGHYLIIWWVATNGADTATGVNYSLNVDGISHSTGASPQVPGHTSGTALITVSAAPVIVTLTNDSEGRIALPTDYTQANLVIMAIPV